MKKLTFIIGLMAMVWNVLWADSNVVIEHNGIYFRKLSDHHLSVTYRDTSYNSYKGVVKVGPGIWIGDVHYLIVAVDGRAFKDCDSLTSVTVELAGQSVFPQTIGDYAFQNCRNLTFATIVGDVDNNGLGKGIFAGCTALQGARLNITASQYSDEMFCGCTSLTSLPSLSKYDIPRIGRKAFAGCNSLTQVRLPIQCSWGDSAFADCIELKTIIITSGSSQPITHDMFAGCSKLASVVCPSINPPVLHYANYFDSEMCDTLQLKVPASSVEAYQLADEWGYFKNIQPLPYDFESGGAYYRFISPDEVEVTHHDWSMSANTNNFISIPQTVKSGNYDGKIYRVVSVADSAFYARETLMDVKLPPSITTIGAYAFKSCTELQYINFPSVTMIGDAAFEQCEKLYKYTLSGRLCHIGDYAFKGCMALEQFVFPSAINYIGNGAFSGCSKLNTIKFCDLIKSVSIGSSAFEGCVSLKQIGCLSLVPPVVNGDSVFDQICFTAAQLLVPHSSGSQYKSDVFWGKFSSQRTLKYDFIHAGGAYRISSAEELSLSPGDNFWAYNSNDLDVPDTLNYDGVDYVVKSVDDYALNNCQAIRRVTLGNSLERIGRSAFAGSGIFSIRVGASLKSIGKEVFLGCGNLNEMIVDEANTLYDSRNECNAIIKTADNCLVYGCRGSIVPPTITSIADSAFFMCTGLVKIEIPNSVRKIGMSAFGYCNSLATVTFSDSLKYMGPGAFAMTSIKSLVIPDGLDSVPYLAFSGCTNLEELVLPKHLKSIGILAFSHCHKLKRLTIPNSVDSIGIFAFLWCKVMEDLTIGSGTTYIGSSAFDSPFPFNHAITSVTCKTSRPPTLELGDAFDSSYANATLYVPISSVPLYKSALGWKEFYHIVGIEDSEVDCINEGSQDKNIVRYNLMGMPVDESYRGVVIENGKKILKY